MYFALCCTHSVVQATVWQALSACSTKVAGPHAYCKAREACRHTSTSELYEAVAACASRLPLCTAGHVRMPGVEPGSQAWEACMMPLHYMRFLHIPIQQCYCQQCAARESVHIRGEWQP